MPGRIGVAGRDRVDPDVAFSVCSEDFVLETPAFGTRGVGKQEVAAQLELFFAAFPDYNVELVGFADGDLLATWGCARISFHGELIGIAPTHKAANLEVTCLIDVKGGVLQSERFIFDRADFCEQFGIPAPELAAARALVLSLSAKRQD